MTTTREITGTVLDKIEPGDTIYTILRHVSSSHTTRDISLVLIKGEGYPFTLDYAAHQVLGYRLSPKGQGIRVSGSGMDMGYHLVYSLSRTLFKEGFACIGVRCPSNDHTNGDRDYTPGRLHSDPGYALRHTWL